MRDSPALPSVRRQTQSSVRHGSAPLRGAGAHQQPETAAQSPSAESAQKACQQEPDYKWMPNVFSLLDVKQTGPFQNGTPPASNLEQL